MMRTREQPKARYPVYGKLPGPAVAFQDLVDPHPLTAEQERLRAVKHMREEQRMTFEAIGEKLGITTTAAFYQYQRAKGIF